MTPYRHKIDFPAKMLRGTALPGRPSQFAKKAQGVMVDRQYRYNSIRSWGTLMRFSQPPSRIMT